VREVRQQEIDERNGEGDDREMFKTHECSFLRAISSRPSPLERASSAFCEASALELIRTSRVLEAGEKRADLAGGKEIAARWGQLETLGRIEVRLARLRKEGAALVALPPASLLCFPGYFPGFGT
jgi:hypothetical protein